MLRNNIILKKKMMVLALLGSLAACSGADHTTKFDAAECEGVEERIERIQRSGSFVSSGDVISLSESTKALEYVIASEGIDTIQSCAESGAGFSSYVYAKHIVTGEGLPVEGGDWSPEMIRLVKRAMPYYMASAEQEVFEGAGELLGWIVQGELRQDGGVIRQVSDLETVMRIIDLIEAAQSEDDGNLSEMREILIELYETNQTTPPR